MLRKLFAVFAVTISFALANPALADKKADATALLNDAIAHVQAVGADKALADFADVKGAFVRGELYVVVHTATPDAKIVVHPINPKLQGMPQGDIKDAAGKQFVREMIEKVAANGEAWIDYKWVHPETKKISQKHALYKKVSDYYIGVGYYD